MNPTAAVEPRSRHLRFFGKEWYFQRHKSGNRSWRSDHCEINYCRKSWWHAGLRLDHSSNDWNGIHPMLIISLLGWSMYLTFPRITWKRDYCWGLHWDSMGYWLNWGPQTKKGGDSYSSDSRQCQFLGWWPWQREHRWTELLADDGGVVHKEWSWGFYALLFRRLFRMKRKMPKGRLTYEESKAMKASISQTFDYSYTLKNGEIQKVKATVHISRMRWAWRMLPLITHTERSIWVDFSDEVGEERGSWKGGTVGCGWNMLPGENMEQALRRMEANRKFER